MVTIKDIANQAGVSTTTVSRVLNDYSDVSDKTRKRIIKIIKENNYLPSAVARSLSTSKSNMIGIFGGAYQHSLHLKKLRLNDPFFREIISGLEVTLGQAGYDLVYFTNEKISDDFSYSEKCKNRNLDGAIFFGGNYSKNDSDLKKLINSGIPSVFIDSDITGENVSYVISNNIKGAKKAIKYLYKLGHRKIAFLMGDRCHKVAQDRLSGVKSVFKENHLEHNFQWIYSGDYTEQFGYKTMKKILNLKEKPTAIFCEDIIALGVLKAIKESEFKIPDDFSVLGFDDIEICSYVNPALTTIKQQKTKMGRSAAKLLLDIINKGKNHSPIVLSTKLIERNSCKSLKIHSNIKARS